MNPFEDDKNIMADIADCEDLVKYANQPETVARLEERLKDWLKKVQEVILHFKTVIVNFANLYFRHEKIFRSSWKVNN